MKSWWFSLVLYGLGIGATGAQAISPQKIDPPLGLFWGESQKSIEEKNTLITDRAVVMQRDAWTLDRFPDSGLKKAILYFGKVRDAWRTHCANGVIDFLLCRGSCSQMELRDDIRNIPASGK